MNPFDTPIQNTIELDQAIIELDQTIIEPVQNTIELDQVVIEPIKDNIKKRHHNIVDMYWLINEKLFNQQALGQGEAGLLAIGYNADFGNLRIGFHEVNGESFTKSSMIKDKMKFLTSINFFSETAYAIRDCLRNGKPVNISNFERIIGSDNKWTPNQTQITGDTNQLIIKTMTPEGKKYNYTFSNWQIPAFATALKYMTEGQSWDSNILTRIIR